MKRTRFGANNMKGNAENFPSRVAARTEKSSSTKREIADKEQQKLSRLSSDFLKPLQFDLVVFNFPF